jgi:uncharacterized protein YbbC (DUF1343 family)
VANAKIMTETLKETDKIAKKKTLFDLDCCSFVMNLLAMKKGQFNIPLKIKSEIYSFRTIGLIFLLFISNLSHAQILTGADQTQLYIPKLKNKRVAIVANPTSVIGRTHLVDSLFSLKIKIKKIFAPEHGFRGEAANGDKIHNSIDPKTNIPIVSLYGKNIKPSKKDLADVDIVIFDIQDVGVRFYTFLTTLHYVMEACAEYKKPLILFDRPNPNGYFIDGPILEDQYKSMVGMHPIPLVHGMTLGELGRMINGEKWLTRGKQCMLDVIPMKNYDHNMYYELPIAPSPNLPTITSIFLYPTLGLLEGTEMSMGRGTNKPFECFGAPWLKAGNYSFTPQNIIGKAVNPPFVNQLCNGFLLTDFANDYIITYKHLYIEWIVMLYKECPNKATFFNSFIDKLIGTESFKTQIKEGKTAAEIRTYWQIGLQKFKIQRLPYMLYPYDNDLGIIGKKEKK